MRSYFETRSGFWVVRFVSVGRMLRISLVLQKNTDSEISHHCRTAPDMPRSACRIRRVREIAARDPALGRRRVIQLIINEM